MPNFSQILERDYLKETWFYPHYNQTVKWTGFDDEERFQRNLKLFPDNSSIIHYRDNPIEYRINEYGYRTDDNFTQSDATIYLGCSQTTGVGLHLEDSWPYKVHKEFSDTILANLSQPAQGIENQFRQLYRWKDYFNVKNIFHFQPIYAREELLSDRDKDHFILANHNEKWNKNVDKYFSMKYFASSAHTMRKYVTNAYAIRALANSIGASYFLITDTPTKKPNVLEARDLIHLDVGQTDDLALSFISKFNNNDTEIDIEYKSII